MRIPSGNVLSLEGLRAAGKGRQMLKLGLAPLTLFRPHPLELVRCAGEAGYEAVGFQLGLQEVPVSPLVGDASFLREAKTLIDHYGLEVMEVSNIVFEPNRTFAEGQLLIDFAVEMGASIVQATVWDEDRARVVERLAHLCEYAEQFSLDITVEYMPYSKCVSFDDALSLVVATGRSNAKILLDTLHFHRSHGDVSDLSRPVADRYSFIQLCDARAGEPAFADLREESVWDRLPCGEGAIPLREIVSIIPTALPVSLEIPCRRLQSLPLLDQAREHLRLAREFLTPFADRWSL